jgi:glucoamylase
MKGPHGDGRYFVRVDGDGQPDSAEHLPFANGAGSQGVRRIVNGGFLELVRLGVMHPDDWAITASLPELD